MRAILKLLALVSFATSPLHAADLIFTGPGERMVVPAGSLTNVFRRIRDDGVNEVTFQLNKADRQTFEDMTTRLEGQLLTMTYCEVVLLEATVLFPIEDGSVLITGGTDPAMDSLFQSLKTAQPCPDDLS